MVRGANFFSNRSRCTRSAMCAGLTSASSIEPSAGSTWFFKMLLSFFQSMPATRGA
jgi:hypothetical protein